MVGSEWYVRAGVNCEQLYDISVTILIVFYALKENKGISY